MEQVDALDEQQITHESDCTLEENDSSSFNEINGIDMEMTVAEDEKLLEQANVWFHGHNASVTYLMTA